MAAITSEQARDYVSGYLDAHDDCERFKIKSVGPSRQGPECLEVSAYVEWQNGDNVGNDTTIAEVMVWTCWLEPDGCGGLAPFGEY